MVSKGWNYTNAFLMRSLWKMNLCSSSSLRYFGSLCNISCCLNISIIIITSQLLWFTCIHFLWPPKMKEGFHVSTLSAETRYTVPTSNQIDTKTNYLLDLRVFWPSFIPLFQLGLPQLSCSFTVWCQIINTIMIAWQSPCTNDQPRCMGAYRPWAQCSNTPGIETY